VTFQADQIAIRTEIERAKTAWDALPGSYPLLIDYENKGQIDLSKVLKGYLVVDIVYRDGDQLDLGDRPLTNDRGQIMLAAGAKDGGGTVEQLKLLDHFRPYLQLRDNLGNVRTHAARRYQPTRANGFYYLPMVIGFWSVGVSPAVPV
jgi:hypothetical protein